MRELTTRRVLATARHATLTVALLIAATGAQATSRRDIAAAHAACVSIGSDYAQLSRALAADRAILSPVRNGRALVGYPRAFWGPRWVCRVEVDERGIIRRIRRLDRDAPPTRRETDLPSRRDAER